MDSKKAIMRGQSPGGAPREAYEELKEWAIDDLKPQMRRLIEAKMKLLEIRHGVTEREILQLLMRPPAGEARPKLVEFLYDTLFS